MTILILTLLGAAASVGFSCFQIQKQEEANASTQAQIRQLQDMQRQSLDQQQVILRNQAPRNKDVHVYATAPAMSPGRSIPATPAKVKKPAATPAANRGYTELP